MIMEQKQIIKQALEFNQTTFNNAFDAMVLIQDEFERMTNATLDQIPGLPVEGRKALDSWTEVLKDSRKEFKTQIEKSFKQAEKVLVI